MSGLRRSLRGFVLELDDLAAFARARPLRPLVRGLRRTAGERRAREEQRSETYATARHVDSPSRTPVRSASASSRAMVSRRISGSAAILLGFFTFPPPLSST